MSKNRNFKLIDSGTDSSVYMDFGVLRKLYYSENSRDIDENKFLSETKKYKKNILNNLTLDILQKYHMIHSALSKFYFEKNIKNQEIFYGNIKIHKIIISVLDLGKTEIKENYHLNTKEIILITEPKYISTVEKNKLIKINSSNLGENIIMDLVSCYFKEIGLKKIGFINSKNIAITNIENNNLYLTITDLGNAIEYLVKNEKYIYARIGQKSDLQL